MSKSKTLKMNIKNRYPKIFRLDEVHSLAKIYGAKESNFERRLRNSESPEIETMYNEKRHIIGYRYRDEYMK